MGDADLEGSVAEVKARGLAVFWRNQILGTQDGKGNYLPYPPATAENVLKSYDALEICLEEGGPSCSGSAWTACRSAGTAVPLSRRFSVRSSTSTGRHV